VGHHAGARRRRADDGHHAAVQHATGGAPAPRGGVVIHLNLGSATRWGLNCLLLLALSLALYLGRVVFIPIIISRLLAAMLWPAVQWLNTRLRLPWSVACSVMIGLLVVFVAATAAGLATAVPKVVQQLPTDEEAAETTYGKFRTRLAN